MNCTDNKIARYSYDIFISGLKIPMHIGCRPEEREFAQTVQLDLVFTVELDSALNELDQGVCYLTAAEFAKQHAAKQHWVLIENYLESLCDQFFTKFPTCTKIESRLSKFVVPACEAAGVKITRHRSKAS